MVQYIKFFGTEVSDTEDKTTFEELLKNTPEQKAEAHKNTSSASGRTPATDAAAKPHTSKNTTIITHSTALLRRGFFSAAFSRVAAL